jgi:hypothetical protein
MDEMLASGERAQHFGGLRASFGLAERSTVEIDDRICRDDQAALSASGHGIGLRTGMQGRKLARSIARAISFGDVARNDADVETERGK